MKKTTCKQTVTHPERGLEFCNKEFWTRQPPSVARCRYHRTKLSKPVKVKVTRIKTKPEPKPGKQEKGSKKKGKGK